MSRRLADERDLEKQIGCITACFRIFDRLPILTGKCLHAAGRFSSAQTLESDSLVTASPEGGESNVPYSVVYPNSECSERSPLPELRPLMPAAASESPSKSPIAFPMSELSGGAGASSSRRFWREVPRLSLDSRANTDARGSLKEICASGSIQSSNDRRESVVSDAADDTPQRWSPSIIARLMGLEAYASENEKTSELRRSASESRASTGLIHALTMADSSRSSSNHRAQSQPSNFNRDSQPLDSTPKDLNRDRFISYSSWRVQPPRSSVFFFPEPKYGLSIYKEIENKLRKRGINEHTKDLETLKQILEALQLKGLLHSGKTSAQNQVTRRNFVYEESPIIATESSRTPVNRRTGNVCSSSGVPNRRNRSNVGGNSPTRSPRREKNARSPITTDRSPTGNTGGRRSSLPAKPKPPRTKRLAESRRASPVQPPNSNSRRTGTVYPTVNSRSPRSSNAGIQNEKITSVVAEDESLFSISGSNATTSVDTEEGRSHSLGKMGATDMHPSPVSVLDLPFESDEAMTPSPITLRRNIDFKDHSTDQIDELEDATLVSLAQPGYEQTSDDPEFNYISCILTACSHFPGDSSNTFLLLEKQRFLNGKDASKLSMPQRKLIFDAVNEILDRHTANSNTTQPSLAKVQSEFQRMRKHDAMDNLFDSMCSILKKDLLTSPWGGGIVQISEVVLDIERMVFKDLINDMIRDLTPAIPSSSVVAPPRRKLGF